MANKTYDKVIARVSSILITGLDEIKQLLEKENLIDEEFLTWYHEQKNSIGLETIRLIDKIHKSREEYEELVN